MIVGNYRDVFASTLLRVRLGCGFVKDVLLKGCLENNGMDYTRCFNLAFNVNFI